MCLHHPTISFSFHSRDGGESSHSKKSKEKFLQMSDWLLKANEADVGYSGRQAGDPEDVVDHERMVELHGVAGEAEVVVYDYHVPQVDAVAEPSQR